MSPISDSDADRIGQKPRPKGKLPYLPDAPSVEELRAWLTRAFRPPSGFEITGFDRLGRDREDACVLIVAAGRETRKFRFVQRDLVKAPRAAAAAVSDGWLAMPHLTASEVEDLWMALCTLGRVLTEHDDADEAREWIELMLPATTPLSGHTLVPDGRHDALMALKAAGEFGKADALALLHGNGEERWQARPTRFIDSQTGEQWLRTGEVGAYVRHVIGVEAISPKALRGRMQEIGVLWRLFEDYRGTHPKLRLYLLTEELIRGLK